MPTSKGWIKFDPKDLMVSKGKGGVSVISWEPKEPNCSSPSKDLKAKGGKRLASKHTDNRKASRGK
jgi:hypothetical protein